MHTPETYFDQGEHLRGRPDLKELYDFEGGSVIKDTNFQWSTFPASPPSGTYAFVKLNSQKTAILGEADYSFCREKKLPTGKRPWL